MPGTDNDIDFNNGLRIEPSSSRGIGNMQKTSDDQGIINWDADPEGVVAANPGSRLANRSNGTYWLKVTGTGNTGWEQVSTGNQDSLHTARYIVSAGGIADGANYTTIQSAITAATSDGAPQTVFVQPGTYTEDITLAPQINICAYVSDAFDEVVKVVGKVSSSITGECSLSGICFETNGDFCLETSGANVGMLSFNSCRFLGSDNTAIRLNAANTDVRFVQSFFSTESSNILFSIAATIGVDIRNSEIKTALGISTVASGSINFFNSKVQGFTVTTSGTGFITANNSWFFNGGVNLVNLTAGGSGVHIINNCFLESGSATALTVNSNLTLANIAISSTNATAIDGSGTVKWASLSFQNTGKTITTTTQQPLLQLNNIRQIIHPAAYPYTVLKSDEVIFVDTSSSRTINLPASPENGLTFTIKDDTGSADSNNITITPAAGNIDGAASATINTAYGAIRVVYGGAAWFIY